MIFSVDEDFQANWKNAWNLWNINLAEYKDALRQLSQEFGIKFNPYYAPWYIVGDSVNTKNKLLVVTLNPFEVNWESSKNKNWNEWTLEGFQFFRGKNSNNPFINNDNYFDTFICRSKSIFQDAAENKVFHSHYTMLAKIVFAYYKEGINSPNDFPINLELYKNLEDWGQT